MAGADAGARREVTRGPISTRFTTWPAACWSNANRTTTPTTARLPRSLPASRRRRTSATSCSSGSRTRSCRRSATKIGRRCRPSISTSWPRGFASCSKSKRSGTTAATAGSAPAARRPSATAANIPPACASAAAVAGGRPCKSPARRRYRNLRSRPDSRHAADRHRAAPPEAAGQGRRPRGTATWTTRSTKAPATAARSSWSLGRRGETASSCCC